MEDRWQEVINLLNLSRLNSQLAEEWAEDCEEHLNRVRELLEKVKELYENTNGTTL